MAGWTSWCACLRRGRRHDAERFCAKWRAGHPGAPAFDEGGHMMPNVLTSDRELVNRSSLALAGGEA